MKVEVGDATGALGKLADLSQRLIAVGNAKGLPVNQKDKTLWMIESLSPEMVKMAQKTGDESGLFISHFCLNWDRMAWKLDLETTATFREPDLSQSTDRIRNLSCVFALKKPVPCEDPRAKKPAQCTVLLADTLRMPKDEATSKQILTMLRNTQAGQMDPMDFSEFAYAMMVPVLFTALIPDAMVPITYVISVIEDGCTFQRCIDELDSKGIDHDAQVMYFKALANLMDPASPQFDLNHESSDIAKPS